MNGTNFASGWNEMRGCGVDGDTHPRKQTLGVGKYGERRPRNNYGALGT